MRHVGRLHRKLVKKTLFPLYKLDVVYIDIVLIIPADPRADP